MPAWKNNGNGVWQHVGVDAQSDAIKRGGSVTFNTATLETRLIPWGGPGAESWSIKPVIPSGLNVGPAVETADGWTYACTGGAITKIEAVDLQRTGSGSYLGEFTAEGLKVIYWLPVAGLVAVGNTYRPKTVRITPKAGGRVFVQGALSPADLAAGHVRPLWAIGSLAFYGSDAERNHKLGGINHMTGKAAHEPRPSMWFWAGDTYLGRVLGRYESSGTNLYDKVFDKPEVDSFRSAHPTATQVSVDATLGYTSVGGTTSAMIADLLQLFGVGTSIAVGTISAISFYSSAAGVDDKLKRFGVYVQGATNTDITDATVVASTNATQDCAIGWNTTSVSGTLANAKTHWVGFLTTSVFTGSFQTHYDSGVTGYMETVAHLNQGALTELPSPFGVGAEAGFEADRLYSAYITYSAVVPFVPSDYIKDYSGNIAISYVTTY